MNYKNLLLKYLTGNLSKEDKNTSLNYENLTTIDTSDDPVSFGGVYSILGYIPCTDGNGKPNGKTLVYGNNNDLNPSTSDTNQGYIALFEGDKLLFQTTEYNTGTLFGKFEALEVAEDGTFYGIDYYNGSYRFIMLNNVSELNKQGERQVVLRQSYYLQGNTQISFSYYNYFYVKKSPQNANYIIMAMTADYPHNFNATQLTINVGSPNEWNDFTISITIPGDALFAPLGAYIYYDKDDNPYIEFYDMEGEALNVIKNTGTNINIKEVIYSNISNTFFSGGGAYGGSKMLITGIGSFYLFLNGAIPSDSNIKQKVYIIECINEAKSICYQDETGAQSSFDSYPSCELLSLDNTPIMYYAMPLTNSEKSYDYEMRQYVGLIPKPNASVTYIKQLPNSLSKSQPVLINGAYNLIKMSCIYYIQDGSNIPQKKSTWTIVYNPQNYNNEPYENTNSLVGNNSMLFDANNNLIFARNLYNYKVYNNRVISTLNVPNTYLNDTTIDKQLLLSETNSTILEDTISITKNIYEDLYINDFITLVMENQNEDISIENKAGAIRITQSAFKTNDYESVKATKMKINYSDGSFFVTSTSGDISNDVATYNINLYAPTNKDILTIDILSEDETITYQTITNETISKLNLIGGKYYHISQDVHIE